MLLSEVCLSQISRNRTRQTGPFDKSTNGSEASSARYKLCYSMNWRTQYSCWCLLLMLVFVTEKVKQTLCIAGCECLYSLPILYTPFLYW